MTYVRKYPAVGPPPSLDMFKLWAKIEELVVKSIISGLQSMRSDLGSFLSCSTGYRNSGIDFKDYPDDFNRKSITSRS